MKQKPLVILGSARKDSDTAKLAARALASIDHDVIDLLDQDISPYSYSGDYPSADVFLQLIERMLQYETIIFATPVYWYSMSGIMKTFFDRLTDIVTIRKDLGRKMIGRRTFLIAVGSDQSAPPGFDVPFRLTSEYLDMKFVSCLYCPARRVAGDVPGLEKFLAELEQE